MILYYFITIDPRILKNPLVFNQTSHSYALNAELIEKERKACKPIAFASIMVNYSLLL